MLLSLQLFAAWPYMISVGSVLLSAVEQRQLTVGLAALASAWHRQR
jgi:hypothetical protein